MKSQVDQDGIKVVEPTLFYRAHFGDSFFASGEVESHKLKPISNIVSGMKDSPDEAIDDLLAQCLKVDRAILRWSSVQSNIFITTWQENSLADYLDTFILFNVLQELKERVQDNDNGYYNPLLNIKNMSPQLLKLVDKLKGPIKEWESEYIGESHFLTNTDQEVVQVTFMTKRRPDKSYIVCWAYTHHLHELGEI